MSPMSDTYRNNLAPNIKKANLSTKISVVVDNTTRDDLDRVLEIGKLLLSVLTQDEIKQIEASFKQPPQVLKNR